MRRVHHRNAVTARLDRTLAGAALFRTLDLAIETKTAAPSSCSPGRRARQPPPPEVNRNPASNQQQSRQRRQRRRNQSIRQKPGRSESEQRRGHGISPHPIGPLQLGPLHAKNNHPNDRQSEKDPAGEHDKRKQPDVAAAQRQNRRPDALQQNGQAGSLKPRVDLAELPKKTARPEPARSKHADRRECRR